MFLPDGTRIFEDEFYGSPSSVSSGLVIPDPGNSKRFYLFTVNGVTDDGGPNEIHDGTRYSVLDFSDPNNPVLESSNVVLSTVASESMTAIPNSTDDGYWVLVQTTKGTPEIPAIQVYSLTASGLVKNGAAQNNAVDIGYPGRNWVVTEFGNAAVSFRLNKQGTKFAWAQAWPGFRSPP